MDPKMDIDCEDVFGDNPVCAFLVAKLKSAREANQQLRMTIEDVKRSIASAEAAKEDENRLIAGAARTRYHNGKWCFVVDVASLDPTVIYDDFDVSLKWLHPLPPIAPQYALTIHAAPRSSEICVIVAFESMPFVRHKKYAAEAALSCTAAPRPAAGGGVVSADTRRRIVRLGTVAFSAEEMNGGALEIRSARSIDWRRDDALAMRACSARMDLAVRVPSGRLRDRLVGECKFREVALDGHKCFLLDSDVSHLDGCCLECADAEGVDLVTLYVRDRAHLHGVLHHLHSNIPGATILALERMGGLQREKRDVRADAEKFSESLLRQIDSVIDFHRNVVGGREAPPDCDVTEEYRAMRNALTQIESNTDFLYQQLNPA